MKPLQSYESVKAPKPRATRHLVKPINEKRGGARFPKNVNEPLRAFIRQQRCVIAGLEDGETGNLHRCVAPVVCAHLATRGSGAPDDGNMVPLCVLAHSMQEGQTKRFERRFGVKLKAIARRLTAQFYKAAGTNPKRRKVD